MDSQLLAVADTNRLLINMGFLYRKKLSIWCPIRVAKYNTVTNYNTSYVNPDNKVKVFHFTMLFLCRIILSFILARDTIADWWEYWGHTVQSLHPMIAIPIFLQESDYLTTSVQWQAARYLMDV